MDTAALALSGEMALLARAREDISAFAPLYDRYFTPVYNYIRYRVPEPDTADELTARVFERVLEKLNSYAPDKGPFGSWLFAIAHNVVSDYLRARRRHRWLPLELLLDHPSSEFQPEETALQRESESELLRALCCLSDREREVIALKFAAGLPNTEIAKLTGLSQSNVGVTLYRAVKRLRATLVSNGDSHQEPQASRARVVG